MSSRRRLSYSAKNSRCTSPRDVPLSWKLDAPHGPDIGDEINAAFAGLPKLDREAKIARIFVVMKNAAYGTLRADRDGDRGDDIGPVRREPPHIYELRWRFGRDLYRLYFAEPPEFPNHLVALEFHHKMVHGLSQEDIDQDQNQAISRAQIRYRAGESQNWGL